jgi:hypothetical protein
MGGAASSNPLSQKIANETLSANRRTSSQLGLIDECAGVGDLFVRRKNQPDFVDRQDQSFVEFGRIRSAPELPSTGELSPAVEVFFVDRAMQYLNVSMAPTKKIKQVFKKTLFPSMRPGTVQVPVVLFPSAAPVCGFYVNSVLAGWCRVVE